MRSLGETGKRILRRSAPYILAGSLTLSSIAQAIAKPFKGFCYGPFREGQSPVHGIYPTTDQIEEDLEFIEPNADAIRTYGIEDTLRLIPSFCDSLDIDCFPGVWIDTVMAVNDSMILELIDLVNEDHISIKTVIIGNEALLFGRVDAIKMMEYIRTVKDSLSDSLQVKPLVTTAEPWHIWLQNSDLADSVDAILMLHAHPYWEGIAIEDAADSVGARWSRVRNAYPRFSAGEIIIGETGWPTAGDPYGAAVPSEENQRRFLDDFLVLVGDSINYFWFEAFDEPWKIEIEGEVGGHWGLCYADRTIKPLVADKFVGIEETVMKPGILHLYSCPNPFKGKTTISYSLEGQERVSLKVYNTAGQDIATLVDEVKGPGKYELVFDRKDLNLSNGSYFFDLQVGSSKAAIKAVLVD